MKFEKEPKSWLVEDLPPALLAIKRRLGGYIRVEQYAGKHWAEFYSCNDTVVFASEPKRTKCDAVRNLVENVVDLAEAILEEA